MKLYSSDYARIDYTQETSLLETIWMPRSSELNREGIMKEMKSFLNFVSEKKPKRIIADTRYFGYKVDRELQQWIVLHYMSEIIEQGTMRYGILVSEDVFPELTKNETKEENPEDFQVKYFTSHADAFRWVTGKK